MGNISRKMAEVFQEFTQAGGVRPFGISVLLAGLEDNVPRLFQLDPSGVYHEWRAISIGRNSGSIRQILEKRYKEDLDRDEAIHIGLSALKEKFEGQMSGKTVEIGFIDISNGKFLRLSKSEIEDAISFLKD